MIKGQSISAARGLSGIAYNTQIEFKNLFGFVPRVSWLSLNPYLFADAGLLAFPNGTKTAYSDLLADAGTGIEFTISNWNRLLNTRKSLRAAKPLTIRADFPIFLNNVPNNQEYVQFRWQLGVNKAF